ncbi:MAG: diaminopimelate decarboxylase [Acidimicrobiia bacterium]|nr:MAG: diaminopimelate decarboxylase [Acidimicrobiia bacterium]
MNPVSSTLLPDTAAVSSTGTLSIGGVDTVRLAAEFGTPLFVYDEAHLRARCREAVAAFGDGAVYATKAFLCTAMARLAHDEGMSLDVATGGELSVARAAGVPAADLVFHGNNKSLAELRLALEQEVGCLVIDSFDEIDRIETLIGEGLEPPEVLIRITPGVEAHTHEFVRTGQDDSKFGFTVSTGAASEAVARANSSPAMTLRGIHAHIGSQVFRDESYAEALGVIAEFIGPDHFEEVSIGGGLGVGYIEGEEAPTITEWAETIRAAAARYGLGSRISAEPGRAITASAAVTLYTVGTIKEIPGIRTYVAVDGGMSDNPRPVLYGSGYETFLPRAVNAPRSKEVRLVGKHCETGDVLVSDGRLPADVSVGDIVATPVTGAYGHSMGSNYNKVLRPAVVFVADGHARLVVRRETYDDLLITDLGP